MDIIDRILEELSEPEPSEDWYAVELDIVEVIDIDDVFNEPTRPRKSPFAETTVTLDMPWLRAQLW